MAGKIIVKKDAERNISVSQPTQKRVIVDPTTGGGGEGSAKSIEQWYLMAEALGMTVISDTEITTEAESLWSDPGSEAHDAEDLATIEVDLQGGAMEEFWDIPEEIDIQAVSSTKIINELTAQWAAQTA